jgi:hypothetical protein
MSLKYPVRLQTQLFSGIGLGFPWPFVSHSLQFWKARQVASLPREFPPPDLLEAYGVIGLRRRTWTPRPRFFKFDDATVLRGTTSYILSFSQGIVFFPS